MTDTYEFAVIGSGPAGRRAAVQAAKLGHSVLVIEKDAQVGGYVSTPAPSRRKPCARRC